MAERKKYNPQMHTTEHILNQTMVRMFDRGRSYSAHIEKKKSKCDYHFERDLTEEEKITIENKVNEIISQNLSITELFITLTEAEKQFNMEKLPEGAGENIRIVKVGDYDACPCIGEHVTNTKEIGEFKIISTGFSEEDKRLRIRFKLV